MGTESEGVAKRLLALSERTILYYLQRKQFDENIDELIDLESKGAQREGVLSALGMRCIDLAAERNGIEL